MAAYSVSSFTESKSGSTKNLKHLFAQNEAYSAERCMCLVPVGHYVISGNTANLRPEIGKRQQ